MEILHTLNRGVDKREIFLDDQDRFRFIHDLFEFNNQEWASTAVYRRFKQCDDIACRHIAEERKSRKLLVDIHSFCLMPNHYHLLLTPRVENGIPKFMKKVDMGYAKYFNEKYERKGALFEGRYKSVLVKDQAHLLYLPHYIHLNPLDLIAPEWRDGKLRDYKGATDFLTNYRWSSFLDYEGKKNFPSLTSRNFINGMFGGAGQQRRDIKERLKEMDFESIRNTTLE